MTSVLIGEQRDATMGKGGGGRRILGVSSTNFHFESSLKAATFVCSNVLVFHRAFGNDGYSHLHLVRRPFQDVVQVMIPIPTYNKQRHGMHSGRIWNFRLNLTPNTVFVRLRVTHAIWNGKWSNNE